MIKILHEITSQFISLRINLNPHIFSLFHLRNWLWSNLPTYMCYGKTAAYKRAWTDLMLRSAYPYNLTEWSDNEVNR